MSMFSRIDEYVSEQFATGRFNSPNTEKGYRRTLHAHADDVGNRDPSKTNRDDVKRTLARWSGNTRALAHAHLISFYDWAMEEGVRKDNPARQVRRTRRRKPIVYRLTRSEVRAFRAAARGDKETALADLGLLAGLRLQELQGMQGRHFRRPGWVWVSSDIGKGGKERWVPVLPELQHTWARCAETPDSEFVLPAQRSFWSDRVYVTETDPLEPMAPDSVRRLVEKIAKRAGIRAHITTHSLRHAFGDHIARFGGLKVAQFVLGHATVGTTEGYTGEPTLDEVRVALEGFGYGVSDLSTLDRPVAPVSASVARFRVESGSRHGEPNLALEGAAQALSYVLAGLRVRLRPVAKEMADV